MQKDKRYRSYGLSIAGFDPSAGAGILADAKTMEQLEVYGLTVCTAITVQHESTFLSLEWVEDQVVFQQLNLLLQKYPVDFCKIGLIKNWTLLNSIVDRLLEHNPRMKIVVDPIFRASAGFDFHKDVSLEYLQSFLSKIYLLTPNAQELARIGSSNLDLIKTARRLAQYCPILFKGGHNESQKGTDFLLIGNTEYVLPPQTTAVYFEKHGSGCVLSSAIVAYLAKGLDLPKACEEAKTYISNFLSSNEGLLGYHK